MHHLTLDLDDLVRINKAWLYKVIKVSGLQAKANLAQKEECWIWSSELLGSILTGNKHSVTWFICFQVQPILPILVLLSISPGVWNNLLLSLAISWCTVLCWLWCKKEVLCGKLLLNMLNPLIKHYVWNELICQDRSKLKESITLTETQIWQVW